jgi:hypothetical protein
MPATAAMTDPHACQASVQGTAAAAIGVRRRSSSIAADATGRVRQGREITPVIDRELRMWIRRTDSTHPSSGPFAE